MENNDVRKNNFLRQFRDKQTKDFRTFTAAQFMETWKHYDLDGNGYIEGKEFTAFIKEFVTSANSAEASDNIFPSSALEELRLYFLEAYDVNQDGKIDITELAEILPTDENFLLFFRKKNPLDSSVEFMKTWKEFDKDLSGFIEVDELKNFLRHLLREAKRDTDLTEDMLTEYTDSMLQIFDVNEDGKLQLSEMARLLPVKENFLCRSIFQEGGTLTRDDVIHVFEMYDRNSNGYIESEELNGFLKDLIELVKSDYEAQDVEDFRNAIMEDFDIQNGCKVTCNELIAILLTFAKTQDLNMLN